MTEEWDDINEHARAEWRAETTPFERVHEVVEQTREAQSAAEIADRALVSEPTARRHCEALVNTGVAETEQDGQTTRYRHNPDHLLTTRIHELRAEHSRETLVERVAELKAEIRGYEQTYDVLSPEELARELDPEDATGWADLTEWQTTRKHLALAQAALACDEASRQLTA
jgi:predicted ArsR family transcriptional regulator